MGKPDNDPMNLHLHIDLHPDENGRVTRQLDNIITLIQAQGAHIMADVASVKQLVVELGTETDTIASKVDAQMRQITDLKAQLASGSAITQADLDAISEGLTPISARLKALGSDPSDPIPAESPL